MSDLTPQQARFVEEYLLDLNGTRAAIRAGYSPKTASQQAARLLANVKVKAAVAAAMEARSARVSVEADDVLRELWGVATADAGDLVEFRRDCCRYCWGKGFRYQETAAERASRRRAYEHELEAAAEDDEAKVGEFDELGGVGFDPRRPPHPDCPECAGEGRGEAFIKDTRLLKPDARRLYGGVKVTKDGIEVKLHDKLGALQLVGRHLGMFKDKVEADVTVRHEDALDALR